MAYGIGCKMRVLGFDISTVATGWAIVEDGKYISSGVIRPIRDIAKARGVTQKSVKEELGELHKFLHIVNRASEVIKKESPDVVVVEDTFVKIFPGSTIKVNGNVQRLLARISGGVLYFWLTQFDTSITRTYIVMASKARATIGCKGNAKKPEVIQFIRDKYGVTIDDDNEADAFVLAKYGTEQKMNAPKMKRTTRRRWKR